MFGKLKDKVTGRGIVIFIMIVTIMKGLFYLLTDFSIWGLLAAAFEIVLSILLHNGVPSVRWWLAFTNGAGTIRAILLVAWWIGNSEMNMLIYIMCFLIIILQGFLAWTLVYNKKVEDFLYDQQIENKW